MECSKCKEKYDLKCVNMTTDNFNKVTDKNKKQWVCQTCINDNSMIGDSSTPIYSSSQSQISDNVSQTRRCRGKTGASPNSGLDERSQTEILTQIKLLRQDIQELKCQLDTVSSTLQQKTEEYEKRLQDKDLEIFELKTSLADVQSYLNNQEQYHLRNELEIAGLPEQKNESLTHLILTTSKKLGVDLSESDIDQIHRVGRKRNQSPNNLDKPRPVTVKLLRKSKRDELLSAAKVRRNMTSQDLITGPPSTLYFNERLTKTNRKLFGEARKRAKEYKYRFCWVRNGAIYVRKGENTNEQKYPAILIRSLDDIDELIGSGKGTSLSQSNTQNELFRSIPN